MEGFKINPTEPIRKELPKKTPDERGNKKKKLLPKTEPVDTFDQSPELKELIHRATE